MEDCSGRGDQREWWKAVQAHGRKVCSIKREEELIGRLIGSQELTGSSFRGNEMLNKLEKS